MFSSYVQGQYKVGTEEGQKFMLHKVDVQRTDLYKRMMTKYKD